MLNDISLDLMARLDQWSSATDFWPYARATALAVLAYLALQGMLSLALQRLGQAAAHTTMRLDDMVVEVLGATRRSLLLLVAVLLGLGSLDLGDGAAWIHQAWFAVVVLQVGLWGQRAIALGVNEYTQRGQAATGEASATAGLTVTAMLVVWALRTVLWAIVLLALLSNLGINVTALVASLGVGGIAIALAAQNILGDLFASVAIAADKPFEVGDFIAVGALSGNVERVGLKTTRLRSLGGEQIIMSNTDLMRQTVLNYKRLERRRIVFGFGVTYDTTADQVTEIPLIVRRLVEASHRLTFGRAHFQSFGESSLDFEVVYHVNEASYDVYMDEQQALNLGLMREFTQRGIEFAFPTRTVNVTSTALPGTADLDARTLARAVAAAAA